MKEKAVSFAVIVLVIIIIVVFIGVAAYLALNASPDADGSSDETFTALSECTSTYLKDFAPIFDNLCYLLQKVDDSSKIVTPPDGWDYYAPATGDFKFTADLDEDLWYETTISGIIKPGPAVNLTDGTIKPGTDLSNGMQPDEIVRADWTMKEDGVEKGSGAFSFVKLDWNSYRMTIVNETEFSRQETCRMEFTSFGLHLNVDEIETMNPFNSVYTGIIEFATQKNSDKLEGMVTFDGSDTAMISGTYKGTAYNLTFNLETYETST